MAISDSKKRVMITVSKEVAERLEKVAEEQGLTKSALVTTWVNQELKKA